LGEKSALKKNEGKRAVGLLVQQVVLKKWGGCCQKLRLKGSCEGGSSRKGDKLLQKVSNIAPRKGSKRERREKNNGLRNGGGRYSEKKTAHRHKNSARKESSRWGVVKNRKKISSSDVERKKNWGDTHVSKHLSKMGERGVQKGSGESSAEFHGRFEKPLQTLFPPKGEREKSSKGRRSRNAISRKKSPARTLLRKRKEM